MPLLTRASISHKRLPLVGTPPLPRLTLELGSVSEAQYEGIFGVERCRPHVMWQRQEGKEIVKYRLRTRLEILGAERIAAVCAGCAYSISGLDVARPGTTSHGEIRDRVWKTSVRSDLRSDLLRDIMSDTEHRLDDFASIAHEVDEPGMGKQTRHTFSNRGVCGTRINPVPTIATA
jgi:hypothetical protein